MAHPAVEPGPLHSVAGVGDEQADAVWCEDLVPGVDPYVAALILPRLNRDQHQVEPCDADLRHLLEAQAYEGGGQSLPEYDLVGGLEVLLLPSRHLLADFEITRCDDVTCQGKEAWCQA